MNLVGVIEIEWFGSLCHTVRQFVCTFLWNVSLWDLFSINEASRYLFKYIGFIAGQFVVNLCLDINLVAVDFRLSLNLTSVTIEHIFITLCWRLSFREVNTQINEPVLIILRNLVHILFAWLMVQSYYHMFSLLLTVLGLALVIGLYRN